MGSMLSVVASIAIIRSSFNQFLPPELRSYLQEFSRRFSSELTWVVEELHEESTNDLFKALGTYLGNNALSSPTTPRRVTVGKNESMKVLTFGLDRNSEIVDSFNGVPMKWTYNTDWKSRFAHEFKWYELRFHKQHNNMVHDTYLPYILDKAKRIKDESRLVKFYTSRRDEWSCKGMNLDHPMTFETLAMDGDLKQRVIEDLDSFTKGKEYYKKIGKVWKRGYLLYGPPGTGKSSLIAAMANYLNFDIYNLNLSTVISDSALEHLLLQMTNRSILVVEDIDCSIVLQNRQVMDHQPDQTQIPRNQPGRTQIPRTQITLAGLLNAIDGLLSCCGDERIVVFTTNYKDRIDPALLRAGRMDMRIYLSYCTFSTFKQLAANYLNIWEHDHFSDIEKLIRNVQVSPAEVAGELMKNRDRKASLEELIRFLESKQAEAKSVALPPPVSQELEDRPEDGNDVLGQKDEHQVQSSCKTIDLAGNAILDQNEVRSPAIGSASIKESGYTIKAELEPILEVVFSKHGDIAANCFLHSVQCRSAFLEIACEITQKLQATESKNLARLEFKSMLSSVHDLESVRLDVGWLHQRLDEIIEAMPPFEDCATQQEEEKNI